VQWLSKIYEPGAPTNDFVARWRVEGIMSVTDEAPTIFLNGSNPASVAPFGSYVDAGAVCQDVVDGEITSASTPPASFTTNPVDPNISPVGPGGSSFTITYICTDSAGFTTQLVRTVVVQDDTTPPVVTLKAAPPQPGRDLTGLSWTSLSV
jgi:hypothetical protein